MSIFTEAEIAYLESQPLMRFASASPEGRPDVAPVIFSVDGDDIVTAGFDVARTVRYRNVQRNPRVTVVIDDLASVDPWSPRGLKIIGTAEIEEVDGAPQFRIRAETIISWALNDTTPGIPKMERRKINGAD
jgi:pyridoxamine 5'-phosphate oxidase family protein